MIHDRSGFETFEEVYHLGIGTANQIAVLVKGRGSVRVKSFANGQWRTEYLYDVLCVPDLCKNLFSLTKCADAGYKVIIKKNEIQSKRQDGQVIMNGIINNGLTKMLIKIVRSDQVHVTEEISPREIHEKLGHVNINIIRKMIKEGCLLGLKLSENVYFTCEACNYGKQIRSIHRTQPPRDVQPGELIHSDVCGPFEEIGLNGEKYFVVFKDDACGYRKVYLLFEVEK